MALGSAMPELSALRMLHVVREHGSFSAAGVALSLSQQAVSSRMRALERLLGIRVFARSPRGSILTARGELVADWADEVLAAAERMEAGVVSIRSESVASLRIVGSQTIAEHLLPHWMVTLRRTEVARGRAATSIELAVANSRGAAESVREGNADIGFIESPILPRDLASTKIRDDDMTVVVSPEHPWARHRLPLTIGELARTALVVREHGSGTRDALEHALSHELPDVALTSPALELSTSAAVRSAIAAGTAPGVLSEVAVRDDIELGRLVRVPAENFTITRPLSALWKKGAGKPEGAVAELVRIAKRTQAPG